MKYKHIIWDWNGTLLDDAWLCVEILNKMLACRNMTATTLEQYQNHFDFPVIDYYLKLGFDFAKEDFDSVAREYILSYNAHFQKCSLRKGIRDAISQLKTAGFSQSVLSASQQTSLIEALECYNLKSLFENICGLDDYYAHGKVDAGKKLMRNLKAHAKEILLIGDTTHDYQVACELGADCMLLPAGHQSRERLAAAGAKVCNDLNEALKNLI
ncbi:MAG: Phosphoglycolate phosphatase [Planctomycetes bacterium ADurb.Bin401]|nr:MAG: Phosphoglycolate phosphatase [Planctomycetes bacterium ADurb.Bin401]